MPRRRRTRTFVCASFHAELVRLYRALGPNHRDVAAALGCDVRTARRGYDVGWPGLPPVSKVLDAEKSGARTVAAEMAAGAAEAAAAGRERERAERQQAATQERQLLRVARGNVLSSLIIAAELLPAMRTLTKIIGEACTTNAGTGPKIAPANAMALIVRHALVVQRAVGATEAIVQLSRLDRGEATVNVGTDSMAFRLEDALAELESLAALQAGGAEPRTAGRLRLAPAWPACARHAVWTADRARFRPPTGAV